MNTFNLCNVRYFELLLHLILIKFS